MSKSYSYSKYVPETETKTKNKSGCDYCLSDCTPKDLDYWSCELNHKYKCCASCWSLITKKFDKILKKGGSTTNSVTTANDTILHAPPLGSQRKNATKYSRATIKSDGIQFGRWRNVDSWCFGCMEENKMGLQATSISTWASVTEDTQAKAAAMKLLETAAAAASASSATRCNYCNKNDTLLIERNCDVKHQHYICQDCHQHAISQFELAIKDRDRRKREKTVGAPPATRSLGPKFVSKNGKTVYVPWLKFNDTKDQDKKGKGKKQNSIEDWCMECLEVDLPSSAGRSGRTALYFDGRSTGKTIKPGSAAAAAAKAKANANAKEKSTTSGETKSASSTKSVKTPAKFGVCNPQYCRHHGLLGPGCGAILNSKSMEDKHSKLILAGGASAKLKKGQYPTNKQAKIHFRKANKPINQKEEEGGGDELRSRSFSTSSTGSTGSAGNSSSSTSNMFIVKTNKKKEKKEKKQSYKPAPALSFSGIGRAKAKTAKSTTVKQPTPSSSKAPLKQLSASDIQQLQAIRAIVGDGPSKQRIMELLSISNGNVSKAGKVFNAKERACIAYMESTVVDISTTPPSFKPSSLSLSHISSILKHPNKSFFNPIPYILTSFYHTLCYTIYKIFFLFHLIVQ